MSALLRTKLLRDVRASWSRFALMVTALAISLTAFGGVLSAWAGVGRETSSAYMSTQPASATIVLERGLEPARLTALAAEAGTMAGVLATTGRTQFTSQVAVNGAARGVPLQVFVATPDDPMRMVKFDLGQSGTWPPAPDELLVTADSLNLLGASIGDTLTLDVPGAASIALRLARTVFDPSLAPSPQEQTAHGYVSSAAWPLARLDQLKIQVAEPGQTVPTRSRETVMKVASDVATWLRNERGLDVVEIQVPEPYAHPHQWQGDALLGSLLAGAATALLLSAILAANMLNGLFTQQIPQIGIMKAIGARTGHIVRLYLALTLLVALAATFVAIPPAVLLGRFQVEKYLTLLGIQPESFAAPWWAYALIVGVGLAVPPLIALAAVIGASRTTVREAIDHHGARLTPGPAAAALTRLSRVASVDRGLLMALRNTVRRPARFALAVVLVGCAGTVFVAAMSLSAGTQAIDDERKQALTWDVDVQLTSAIPADDVAAIVRQVPNVSQIEAWDSVQTGVAGPGQFAFSRTYPDQGHGRVSLTAVPPEAPTLGLPSVVEGRWLKPEETGAVVLDRRTRDKTVPGLRPGGAVQLFIGGRATPWQVVGIADELGTHSTGGVYTTAQGLADALGRPRSVNQLRITTDRHDEPSRVAVAGAVERALVDKGVAVKAASSVSRMEAISAGHLGPVILVLLGVALPLGLIGGIGLATTMSANVLDRTREFGVLHAIGARPARVRRIVTAEGIFIALASLAVAVIPTLVLTAVLGVGWGSLYLGGPLPFRVSAPAAIVWSLIAVLGSVLATEAAATRAGRLTVREALAYL